MTQSAQTTNDVLIERQGTTLTIELNRADRSNALSEPMVEAMLEAITGERAMGLRLAIFSGRGRNFCSGFDLSGIETSDDSQLLWRIIRVETLLQAIFHTPFPTLALAHGKTVGAGADLFCACAMRVAAPETTFRMPGWRFGVALGTRRLIHRVGNDLARSLLIDSSTFDARFGSEAGFVQQIAAADQWPQIKSATALRADTLTLEALGDLLRITAMDSRAQDMASLIETAGRPGLKQRILAYRATVVDRKTHDAKL